MSNSLGEIGEIYVSIKGKSTDLNKSLDDAKNKAKVKGGEAGKEYAAEFGRKLSDAMKRAGPAMTLALSAPLVLAGKSAFDAAMKMETLESSMKILTGSTEKAKNELKALREMSQRVGGDFYSLAQASRGLIAGFSGNVKETNYVLENFTKLSSVIGISKADFERLSVNLTQIGGSSKLAGDELRETAAILPNLRDLLKQAFGTSASEDLAKMGITGRQALLKIADTIHNSGMKPNLDIMQAKLTEFGNQFFELKYIAGQTLIPIASDIMKNNLIPALKSVKEWMSKLTDEQKAGLVKWAAFAVVLGPAVKALSLVAEGIKGIVALRAIFVGSQAAMAGSMAITEAQALKTAGALTAMNTAAGGTGVAAGAGAAARVGIGTVAGRVLPMAALLGLIQSQTGTNSNAGGKDGVLKESDKLIDLFATHMKSAKNEAERYSGFKAGLKGIGLDPRYASSYYEDAQKKYDIQQRTEMYRSTMGQGKSETHAWDAEIDGLKKYQAGLAKKKGGGAGGGSSAESDELNKAMLQAMAKSISTPSGEASCAYFASQLLNKTGVHVGKIGGAKALIDAVMAGGGRRVSASDARAGDLVNYYGPGYGKQKDDKGNGYHVGVYAGDGYVIDSSGGKTRMNNTVHNGAKFIRPTRDGKFGNTGDLAAQALEAWQEMQLQIAEEQRKLVESLEPIRKIQNAQKANKMKAKGGLMYDVIAMREFGKDFSSLTDDTNKNKVRGIAAEEGMAARGQDIANQVSKIFAGPTSDEFARKYFANRDAIAAYTEELQKQLEKEQNLSAVETAKQEIKRRNLSLSSSEYDALIKLAEAKDKDIAADKEKAKLDEKNKQLDERRTEGLKQYSESMRSLGERTAELGRSTEVNEYRLRKFALAFAGGNEELSRSADILAKAKNYLTELVKIEDLERLKAMFQSVADGMVTPIRDALGDLMRVDMPDFFRSLGSIIDNALRDIAHKVIEYQIRLQLNNFLGNLFGHIFGGALGGAMGASPGGGLGGVTYGDGAGGPPTDAVSGRGRASNSMQGAGGNVYITINASDAASVISSKDQIALAMGDAVASARRKY